MTDHRQEPGLGVLLFVAYRALEKRAYDAVAAAGGDITLAQARIASRIGPDGTRLSDLAEQARVTKQSAGFLVDQLAAAGYVERVPDPSDGRARLVRLTARAREVVALANAEVERTLEEWRAHVGAERLAAVEETLRELREVADPWA